jgi:hypothetical protein
LLAEHLFDSVAAMGLATERQGDADALARAAEVARPVTAAAERRLPVLEPMLPLLPEGLQRGSTVAVTGAAATSLALDLAAGPSAAGSWVGVLGVPSLGLLAAAEAGVVLGRLVLVARPEPSAWPSVLATLMDGMDVVIAAPPRSLPAAAGRRLHARLRDRGGVLCLLGRTSGLDVDITLTASGTWVGLEQGAGYLQARPVEVEAVGRRAASRVRRAQLWLPDPTGAVVTPDAEVVPLSTVVGRR